MPACMRCELVPTKGKVTRGLCSKCVVATVQDGTYSSIVLPMTKRTISRKSTNADGYVVVSTDAGVFREHTLVMQESLGRLLKKGENVHHINGVRDDNRLENLELWWRPQPAGQRVSDLLDYIAETYPDEVSQRIKALNRPNSYSVD